MLKWIVAGYAVRSLVTFAAFWWDKRAACAGRRRVPEQSLHALELLGGFPGAIAGQRLLRHKNRKASYRATLWCIVALHVLAWALWFAAA